MLNLLEIPLELQLKIEEALAVLQRSWSEKKPAPRRVTRAHWYNFCMQLNGLTPG